MPPLPSELPQLWEHSLGFGKFSERRKKELFCFREKKRERDRQTDRDRLVQRRENTFFTIETPAHRIARLEGVFFAADETERRKVRTRERTHFPIYFGWTKPDSAIAESICCFFFFRARQFARFSKFAAPDLWRRRTSCEHYRKPNGRLPRARGPNASALSPL